MRRCLLRPLPARAGLLIVQRTGYAVKVGYGKPGNYVDLILLRARDDSSSIAAQPQSLTQAVVPAENLVVGLTTRLLILKHLTVELDEAVSAYTRDVRATPVMSEGSNPLVRLFLVGVALVVRNVWVALHWAVLSAPRRGQRPGAGQDPHPVETA